MEKNNLPETSSLKWKINKKIIVNTFLVWHICRIPCTLRCCILDVAVVVSVFGFCWFFFSYILLLSAMDENVCVRALYSLPFLVCLLILLARLVELCPLRSFCARYTDRWEMFGTYRLYGGFRFHCKQIVQFGPCIWPGQIFTIQIQCVYMIFTCSNTSSGNCWLSTCEFFETKREREQKRAHIHNCRIAFGRLDFSAAHRHLHGLCKHTFLFCYFDDCKLSSFSFFYAFTPNSNRWHVDFKCTTDNFRRVLWLN